MRAFLTFAAYRLLGGLLGYLPPRVGYWLAGWAGWLLYLLSPQLRHTLAGNIRHVIGSDAGESEVEDLVRQACVNINKGHYDLFRLGHLSGKEIKDTVQVEGWENLRRALAEGRGAIVFSAHLGNVDLVMQLPPLVGIPVVAPVQRVEPERLFQYTLALRQSHGIRLIPSDESMIGLFRALKRGGMIALAADWRATNSSRAVEFFGSPAWLPEGPVRVALRTGAPLIPGFALRLPDDSFLLQIEPALELPRTGDEEADVVAGMEMVVETLERRIAQHPEQWLVSRPIWPAA
ncbi:lysophospholipid acyltransferase family protein [Chloroflexota bacterium]